jgi:hypothetical protein
MRRALESLWRVAPAAVVWILAILIALPAPADAPPRAQDAAERAQKLEAFFEAHGCPRPFHAQDYVDAADLYGVDYRLLPAVSVRESTCGVYAHRNNRWGWASLHVGFRSVERGIHYITRELAFGRYYRGKDVDGKLRAYNPNPHYVRQVKHLMEEIDGD